MSCPTTSVNISNESSRPYIKRSLIGLNLICLSTQLGHIIVDMSKAPTVVDCFLPNIPASFASGYFYDFVSKSIQNNNTLKVLADSPHKMERTTLMIDDLKR